MRIKKAMAAVDYRTKRQRGPVLHTPNGKKWPHRTCLLVEGLANVLEAAAATPSLANGHSLLLLLLLVGGAEEGGHLVDARTSALMVAVAHAASHCYSMVKQAPRSSSHEMEKKFVRRR